MTHRQEANCGYRPFWKAPTLPTLALTDTNEASVKDRKIKAKKRQGLSRVRLVMRALPIAIGDCDGYLPLGGAHWPTPASTQRFKCLRWRGLKTQTLKRGNTIGSRPPEGEHNSRQYQSSRVAIVLSGRCPQ